MHMFPLYPSKIELKKVYATTTTKNVVLESVRFKRQSCTCGILFMMESNLRPIRSQHRARTRFASKRGSESPASAITTEATSETLAGSTHTA
jgi:hypothetical protein